MRELISSLTESPARCMAAVSSAISTGETATGLPAESTDPSDSMTDGALGDVARSGRFESTGDIAGTADIVSLSEKCSGKGTGVAAATANPGAGRLASRRRFLRQRRKSSVQRIIRRMPDTMTPMSILLEPFFEWLAAPAIGEGECDWETSDDEESDGDDEGRATGTGVPLESVGVAGGCESWSPACDPEVGDVGESGGEGG